MAAIPFQTMTICINFQFPLHKKLQMKFEENWPRGFRGEVIQRCGQTEDGWTDGWRIEDKSIKSDHNSSS